MGIAHCPCAEQVHPIAANPKWSMRLWQTAFDGYAANRLFKAFQCYAVCETPGAWVKTSARSLASLRSSRLGSNHESSDATNYDQ